MRRLLPLTIFVLVATSSAQAHVVGEPGSQAWSDIWIVSAILLTAALYVVDLIRLWNGAGVSRDVGEASAACFIAGAAMLLVALASPLERMAGALLTAHMVQHVILIAAVPPLIIFGRPEVVFAFALPRRAHRGAVLNSGIRDIARLLKPPGAAPAGGACSRCSGLDLACAWHGADHVDANGALSGLRAIHCGVWTDAD